MFPRFLSAVAAVGLALSGVSAQSSSPYTDPVTGITFQGYQSATSGYTFGIALPESPTDEFIGQLVGPAEGWSGVSFGGGMLNNLLLTAWASGEEVVHSFRITGSYTLPTVYSGQPTPELTPLSCGTSVNSTHIQLTFTCKNCHQWARPDGQTAGFEIGGEFAVMGWAVGDTPVADPSDPASSFSMHTAFGQYGMILAEARSASYDEWAAC